MKYLKPFNESVEYDPHVDPQIKPHLETINDLFVDVVDEFDLYKRNSLGDSIYYDIFHWEYYSARADGKYYKPLGSKKIRITIKDTPEREYRIGESKSFLGFLSTLRSIGYDVIDPHINSGIFYDIDYSNLI